MHAAFSFDGRIEGAPLCMCPAAPPIWDWTGLLHFLSAMMQPPFEIREHQGIRGIRDLPSAIADQVIQILKPLTHGRRQHAAHAALVVVGAAPGASCRRTLPSTPKYSHVMSAALPEWKGLHWPTTAK